MGNEYAPDAIRWLANQLEDSVETAEFSGIVGDHAHTYGYHRSRNVIPRNDYSAVLAADRRGDGDAASALDMKYSAKWMKIVTKRLIDSAEDPDDPRMTGVREFYGTTNGAVVNGRIHNGDYAWRFESSDDSHLWHVHISFLREHANNKQTMQDVLSVITNGEGDMPSVKEFWREDNILSSEAMGYGPDYVKGNKGMTPATGLELTVRNTKQTLVQVAALTALVRELAVGQGLDPDELEGIVRSAVADAMNGATITTKKR